MSRRKELIRHRRRANVAIAIAPNGPNLVSLGLGLNAPLAALYIAALSANVAFHAGLWNAQHRISA